MIRAPPTASGKRLLAHIIEDATLIKLPMEGITKIHVRFKGGKTETLMVLNPKTSGQQVKTPPAIVDRRRRSVKSVTSINVLAVFPIPESEL